jgi:hypothetical protein
MLNRGSSDPLILRNRGNERRQGASLSWGVTLILLLGLIAVACGDDDDDTPEGDSPDEVVAQIEDAVLQDGMVFHAAGDDGSEVWLDPENQRYRRKEATRDGGLTSIGEGWTRYRLDPVTNEVMTEDLTPQEQQPRIQDPAVAWFEPLTALGYGNELELIGLTQADGIPVVALEARTPIGEPGEVATGFLEGRVEVDATSYLPTAFERRQTGETPTPGPLEPEEPEPTRVRYTSQLVSVSEVPEGFFDKAVVEEGIKTLEENIEAARAAGLTPYWLGTQYSGPGGLLALPEPDNLLVDAAKPTAELHYGLVVRTVAEEGEVLADTVVVRMAKNLGDFTPPTVQALAGEIPESRKEITVRGGPAVFLTSLVTPSDLPCATGDCPPTEAPVFTRLAFMIGDTAFQIEALARVGAGGGDLNGYNNEAGLVSLAEALQEAQPPPEQ